MKCLNIYASLVLALICMSMHASASSTLFTVEVDRTQVQMGDSIQLIYTYNGDANQQTPNFDLLKNNFDILASYPSVEQYTFNGRFSQKSRWTFQIEPKKSGKLLIPPLSFNGETTEAVEITVSNSTAAIGSTDEIFIETLVDKSEVYVQEQLKLTYRFYYSINVDSLEPAELVIDDAIIKTLPTARFQRRVDGKIYNIIEITHAILPQRSGKLVIPASRWSAKVAQSPQRSLYSNFGHFQTKRRSTQEKVIQVNPIPTNFPVDAPWIAAEALELSDSWSAKLNELEVGTPITRELSIKAKGLESAQLPKIIADPQIKGLKIYIETPKLNDEETSAGLSSTRIESAAVVVSTNEALTLPKIRIPWWNTTTDTVEYAELPSVTLQAKNSNLVTNNGNTLRQNTERDTQSKLSSQEGEIINEVSDSSSLSSNTSSPTLVYLLALTNLITLIVLVGLILTRRAHIKEEPATQLRSDSNRGFQLLNKAAKQRDGQAFYAALINWAKSELKINTYQALIDYAQQYSTVDLSERLKTLEANLYSNTSAEPQNLEKTLKDVQAMYDNAKRKSANKHPNKGKLVDLV